MNFGRRIALKARDEDITFLAAAIAYYSFVSLLPALLLVLAIGSVIGGEELAQTVVEMTRDLLPERASGTVFDALTTGQQRSGATVLSLLILIWSALRVFRGLDLAFSRIYRTESGKTFVERVRDAVMVLGSVGLAIASMGVIGGVIAAITSGVLEGVGFATLVATLIFAFLPIYYVFPNVQIKLRDALPGAVFTAIGWTVLNALFQVYASAFGGYSVYGILGTVLLLITWFYIAGLLLLLGAVVNVTLMDSSKIGD